MASLYQHNKAPVVSEINKKLLKIRDNKKYPGLPLNKELYDTYILTFNSPYRTGLKNNDRVYTELFVNKKRKSPLILLIHGFGSKRVKLNNYYCFIEKVLKNGFSCAFFNLPFHLHRTPPGDKSGEKLIYFDDIETLKFYHQAVVDIRRLMDILNDIFIFSIKIIFGFSLGSMVAEITLALDKRFSKGVLMLGGGNWFEIHWKSYLAHILKGNCLKNEGGIISKEKCRRFYKKFPSFVAEFKKIEDLGSLDFTLSSNSRLREKTIKKCFLCDPLAFAHMVDREKVLMINSRFDHFFTRKSTTQLWKKLGKPNIYWFNKLHTSKFICNDKILKIVFQFIKG